MVWIDPFQQTVQYLLVSISFPYIHTRQIGHDEGPQLLVVGELEQDTRPLEGQAGHSPITLGSLSGTGAAQSSTAANLESLSFFPFRQIPSPAS